MPNVTSGRPRPITEVAASVGLADEELVPYGREIAKVSARALAARRDAPSGKLVVVSSITPTPPGDGKTTVTIGLGQALWRIKPAISGWVYYCQLCQHLTSTQAELDAAMAAKPDDSAGIVCAVSCRIEVTRVPPMSAPGP